MFDPSKVKRLHSHGELGIDRSGNAHERFALTNHEGHTVLAINDYDEEEMERPEVLQQLEAEAAVHSIADAMFMVVYALATETNPSKLDELRAEARGLMVTYAHNSGQRHLIAEALKG